MENKFKTQPYKHQLTYLNKYARRKFFALLSDMGTGKTWMIINNIAELWSSGDCDAVLVLAPNGVHTNWTRLELEKHMPNWVKWKSSAYFSSPRKAEKEDLEKLYKVDESGELRILTMNWEALRTKNGFAEAVKFCSCSMKLMIACDESDSIKNPSAITTKNLMKLKKFSKWRRIMTGTPINNSPFDAFSQFNFLDENILQTTSFSAFKAEYAEMLPSDNYLIKKIAENKTPITYDEIMAMNSRINELVTIISANGRKELYTAAQNIRESFDTREWDDVIINCERLRGLFNPEPNKRKTRCLVLMSEIDKIIIGHKQKVQVASRSNRMPQIVAKDKNKRPKYKNLDRLSKLIAPHSFRVLKSEIPELSNLPDKIYKNLYFRMTAQQAVAYEKAEKECRVVFENDEAVFAKLVAITKLSQITSGYYIFPGREDPVRIEGGNPKLDLLIGRVDSIIAEGNKVIIWARYTTEIKDIAERLSKDGLEPGVDFVTYYGEIGKDERTAALDKFENGSASVFLGNQQAGGVGLNIVAASYMIYFSNNYSHRIRAQSEDRAHRIGQTKNVTYINILAENTIDEVIIEALMFKKDVSEIIIDKGLKLFGD